MNNCKSWSYLAHAKALPCPAGSRYKDRHELRTNGNNLSLVKVETVDVQEKINSYEDGVSLEKMIGRYLRTGDVSHLTVKKGFYADVSGMERNPARVIDNMRKVSDAVQSVANAPVTGEQSNSDNKEVTNNAE